AGNTTSAYRANNLSALRTQLTTILQGTASPATSRSVPTIVNTGTSLALGGSQFQVTAGFKVGQTATDPWEGRLYRQRNICNGTTPQYADLDSTKGDLFHITLNNQSTRTLNTVVPASVLANTIGSLFAYNGTAIALPATPNLIRPDHTSFLLAYTEVDSSGNAGQAVEEYNRGFSTFDKTINQAYFGDADGNGIGGQTADRDLISDYLRGLTTNRTGKRLGDIYHSNPTVALPIYKGADQTSVFDPTLRQFYTDLTDATGTGTGSTGIALGHYNNLQINQGRPGVVYVGTNDGILHAFNLDDWYDKSGTKYGAGYEFWGFVPPALFNKLAASSSPTHQFMFDGTPIVKDMVTVRTSTNVITMKTVLLAAVRGAPAFVALDVTFPEAPKFLWQRSFTYLGNTTGQPALAEVRVNWGGQVQTRAVAILPGGDGTLASASACDVDQLSRGTAASSTNSAGVANSARAKVRCWNKLGRSLYVVDVETGALIQEFDGRHFHSPMTGGIAVDGEGVAQTRAAYMTDQDGILWRLSMYNPDPSQWRVAPIWDLFAGNAKNFSDTAVAAASAAALYQAGRVSTYPPLLNRDPTTGTVNIILGTGDVDNLTDNAPNRVVSLKEQRVMDGLELGPGKITANWSLQLDAGEAVTGPITMVNDTAYFATFTGPAGGAGDLCTVGSSRLVGAHLRNAASASSPSLPKPMLTPEAGGLPLVLQYRPSTATGSLLLGLSVARDPVCIAGTVTNNNPLVAGSGRLSPSGATGGGTFQLRTMVAGGANSTAGTGLVGSDSANSQRQLTVTLPINNISRSVGWASSIE
ncbi:MAG: Type fimbrial biosis protein PilY1, partial [Myxococcaceae bacterium]|nr:Type fimbrial biosis protein PilY1 [Myxococcaceae bacterium]